MPPKRRRNNPPDPEPTRAASSPGRDQSVSANEEEDDDDNNPSLPLPFYNTTFSAHRVSPLYLGSEPLTATRLQVLAQRLRDRLVGDVVRGVEVGIGAPDGEDSIIGRAGALEKVEIRWVGVAEVLGLSRDELGSLTEVEGTATTDWRSAAAQLPDKKALHISLQYEMASCTALMLPPLIPGRDAGTDAAKTRFAVGGNTDDMDWEHSIDPAHFLALPLLLLRMPTPLKTVVGEFLSTTFDCRVSAMRLGTRSLVRSWEAWIRSAGLPSRGPLAKDVVLSLGFHIPPSGGAPSQPSGEEDAAAADHQQPLGLKTIDVIVPATELRKFVAAGKRLARAQSQQTSSTPNWGWENDLKQRRKLAGRLGEEGWEWHGASQDEGGFPQPFTEALACYLKEHMGLNMFHPGVRVVKIACGGFAMSEMRLKVFTPAGSTDAEGEGVPLLGQKGAVLELLAGLVEKAQAQMVAV